MAIVKVNDQYTSKVDGTVYVIKGAWDGAKPGNDHAFLMRRDGSGHAYAGKVTKVSDVWRITEDEFEDMCGGRRDYFRHTLQGE